MSKIHFLFTMLNISQLVVIKQGTMVGIITKNEFLKSRVAPSASQSSPESSIDSVSGEFVPPLLDDREDERSDDREERKEERKNEDEIEFEGRRF